MVRQAAVAGSFYPGEPSELETMIKGMVDEQVVKEEVIGLMCPHAGYIYSGPVAGATISRIKFKDTFIILGPNHTGMGQPFSIMTEGTWQTPLGNIEIDTELAHRILAGSAYLEEDSLAHRGEHSIEVQLPFLQYFKRDFKLVPIIMTQASGDVYKGIGQGLARAITEVGRETVILASSDMTHYEPQAVAQRKDKQAVDAILDLDEDELMQRIVRSNITMCGYAPAVALISAVKAMGARRAELVKYQTSGNTSGDYSSVVGYAGIIIKKDEASPVVKLAREAVEAYVREGKMIEPPAELTPEMQEQAGVFVSIHKGGELRGCIGTFEPNQHNVAEEVIANAISSATRDPRFMPIGPDELKDLDINVDVLTEPEPIDSIDQLAPKKYGVIVECGYRRGLLLPDLEGVDSVDQQIDICRRKGGISSDEPVKLYRFEVKRYR